VSVDLGTSQTPRAARAFLPGWRDPRLWIGLALVAASVVLGARLLGSEPKTVEVWVADRDLQVGEEIGADDLRLTTLERIGDEVAATYFLRDDDLPAEHVVVRAVGAGELLPRAALGEATTDRLELAVWAPSVAIPGGVRPGSVVDVWITDDEGRTRRALDDVAVVDVPVPDADFGPSGDRQVVLSVPAEAEEAVGEVLAAAHAGTVSITRRS